MKKLFAALCAVTLLAGISFAKDAPKSKASASSGLSRSSLGYNTQINAGVTSLSYRHWGGGKAGFEGLFGFSQGENEKYMDFGIKILSKMKSEQNMCVYWMALIGLENYTIKVPGLPDNSDTETLIGTGFGVEFFFQGLPNLGFGAEMGIANRNKAKVTSLFNSWMSSVGLRYYF